MPPNFAGRAAERKMLSHRLNADPDHPLLVLRALGGFGKRALTWHWLLQGCREEELTQMQPTDGPPDYTYKVTYDEAGALLERLGEKQRMEGG